MTTHPIANPAASVPVSYAPRIVGTGLLAKALGYTTAGIRHLAASGSLPGAIKLDHPSGKTSWRFDTQLVAGAICTDDAARRAFFDALAREGKDLTRAVDALSKHLPPGEPIAQPGAKRHAFQAADGRLWFQCGERPASQWYSLDGADGVLRVEPELGLIQRFQNGRAIGEPRDAFSEDSYPLDTK